MSVMLNTFRTLRKLSSSAKFSTSCFSSQTGTGYIPRRAVLYVPGSDERKIAKVPSLTADCVVLDCEDGVALSQKDTARQTIAKTLGSLHMFSGKDCSVRVNSASSGLCEEDLQTILSSEHLPQTLHLPKVESTDELSWFAEKVSSCLSKRKDTLTAPLRLIMFCESGNALINLPQLLSHGIALSEKSSLLLDGLVFGSDDFCADIGITRSNEAKELLYARQNFVTVVKSRRLQAIDLVYIDYKDLTGLEKQSLEGAAFGFTGKQVIHPGQIPVVQRAFSPSSQRVKWATELLQEFEQHQKTGKGAFTFRGNMIDLPLVLQARNVLQLSSQTNT